MKHSEGHAQFPSIFENLGSLSPTFASLASMSTVLSPSSTSRNFLPIYKVSNVGPDDNTPKSQHPQIKIMKQYRQQHVNEMPFTNREMGEVYRNKDLMKDFKKRKELSVASVLEKTSEHLTMQARDQKNRVYVSSSKKSSKGSLPPIPKSFSQKILQKPRGGSLAASHDRSNSKSLSKLQAVVQRRRKVREEETQYVVSPTPSNLTSPRNKLQEAKSGDILEKRLDIKSSRIQPEEKQVQNFEIQYKNLGSRKPFKYPSSDEENLDLSNEDNDTIDDLFSPSFLSGCKSPAELAMTSRKEVIMLDQNNKTRRAQSLKLLDTLSNVCQAELNGTKESKKNLKKVRKQLRSNYRVMKKHFKPGESVFSKAYKRQFLSSLQDNKGIFVYGKSEKGRYKSTDALLFGIPSKSTKPPKSKKKNKY